MCLPWAKHRASTFAPSSFITHIFTSVYSISRSYMSLEIAQELRVSLGTAIFSFATQFCLCISISTAYLLYFPWEAHAIFELEHTNSLERVKQLKATWQDSFWMLQFPSTASCFALIILEKCDKEFCCQLHLQGSLDGMPTLWPRLDHKTHHLKYVATSNQHRWSDLSFSIKKRPFCQKEPLKEKTASPKSKK